MHPARLRSGRLRGDDGLTVVELMVALGVMSIVLATVMGFLSVMQTNVAKQSARSLATDEARLAAQQLDRHIRSGNVLYDPADTGNECGGNGMCLRIYTQANASQKCVQWRVQGDRLEWRSWTPDWQVDPASRVSGWRTVANDIVNSSSSPVQRAFELDNSATFGRRIMRITILSKVGGFAAAPARVELSVTGRNTQYGYPDTTCNTVPA